MKKIGYRNNDKLFPKKKTEPAFSAYISKIFEDNANKHVTATGLRCSYLTYIYAGPIKFEEEYRMIAKMMAQSREEQLRYRRIKDEEDLKYITESSLDFSIRSIIPFSIPFSIPSTIPYTTIPSYTISFSIPSFNNPSIPSCIPLIIYTIIPSTSSTSISYTNTSSSTSSSPMQNEQFLEFMGKLFDMYQQSIRL